VGKGVTQKPLAPARVYALVLGEPERGSEVVIGTAPILGFEDSILFDSGATYSFVSIVFVRLSRLVMRTLELGLAVTTPVRKTVVCKYVVCECPVSICGRLLLANLVVLPMFNYDVILNGLVDEAFGDYQLRLEASDAYIMERRKSDIHWIAGKVFTSNYFGRAS
jgi:hypothetical protein